VRIQTGALALAVAVLFALSCDAGSTGPADTGPATVRASLDTLTFQWIGQSAALGAAVLDAKGAALAGQPVRWRSSDTALVGVDSAGTATARRVGSALLIVELGRLADTAVARVTQVPAAVVVAPTSLSFTALGDTATLAATVQDHGGAAIPNGSVTWSSADSSVVTVTAQGRARAVKNGSTTVRAAAGPVGADVPVQVAQAVTVLTLDQAALGFTYLGQVRALHVDARDRGGSAAAASVRWSSTDPGVATVDGQGQVRATGAGETVVVAAAGALEARARITVTQTPVRMRVVPALDTLTYFEDHVQLTAELLDEGGSPIPQHAAAAWTSNLTSVPVTGGLVTMESRSATATITATIGSFSAQASVVCHQVADHVMIAPREFRFHWSGGAGVVGAYAADRGGVSVPDLPVRYVSRNGAIAQVGADGAFTVGSGVFGETWIVATPARSRTRAACTSIRLATGSRRTRSPCPTGRSRSTSTRGRSTRSARRSASTGSIWSAAIRTSPPFWATARSGRG
jgi:uncharacterized protein YjdB